MKRNEPAFTIVELLVVIIIVVTLVAVTVFGFSTWRSRVARTEVKNEVSTGAATIKHYKTLMNALPANQAAFDAEYKPKNAVTLTYIRRADGLSFCLNGVSTADSSVKWKYDSAIDPQPKTGTCS